jgi:hypothetical protein
MATSQTKRTTLRKSRGQFKSRITRELRKLIAMKDTGVSQEDLTRSMQKIREYLKELRLIHEKYMSSIEDTEELEAEEDYVDKVAEDIEKVRVEITSRISDSNDEGEEVNPEDSVSLSGSKASSAKSHSSSESVRILTGKAVAKRKLWP